jgi:hypothetical protein
MITKRVNRPVVSPQSRIAACAKLQESLSRNPVPVFSTNLTGLNTRWKEVSVWKRTARWEKATGIAAGGKPCLSVLIVAKVRFLREALAEAVGRDRAWSISGLSADFDQAVKLILKRQPNIVVLDGSFPNGTDLYRRIMNVAPGAGVIVVAVAETEENIIAWAKAGVVGYIP